MRQSFPVKKGQFLQNEKSGLSFICTRNVLSRCRLKIHMIETFEHVQYIVFFYISFKTVLPAKAKYNVNRPRVIGSSTGVTGRGGGGGT